MSAKTTVTMSETKPQEIQSWKSHYANRITAKKITEEYDYFKNTKCVHDPPALPTKPKKDIGKVCIVGAGMAGLYIAMILDELNIPGLSYEILEADNRVGGRIYTHRFSKAKHDYYDVGAMRFPKIDIMKKTFDLFDYLKMPTIEYVLSGPVQPSRYNDITVIEYNDPGKPKPEPVDIEYEDESTYVDPYKVSSKNGGMIMPELVNCPDRYVTEAFEPFKKRLRKNWIKGFQALMKYDEFSVRGFMMSHGITPLDDYYSIQWLETLTDGSGLYDQGFSEGVIDSMDFDYYTSYLHPNDKKKEVHWYCINGGTALLSEAMRNKLGDRFSEKTFSQRVKSIALQRDGPPDPTTKIPGSSSIKVRVNEEREPRKYAAVFNTTTLACLQRVDLTGLELLYEQKDAIRSLHYDTASKVGMTFSDPWWMKYGMKGGLGKTDMPLRTCVYPSYNLDDPQEGPERPKSWVLLVSYCWAQDAARLGSLMRGKPEDENELREMLFNNLTWLHLENAKLHNEKIDFDTLHDEIANSYISHHAFGWHNEPFTSGAYGKFAPGQFQNLYPALSCPTADDRFFFVGEAVSAHHGWIVGALDSAHMAVIRFLKSFGLFDEYEDKIAKPDNADYISWLGPLPDEMSMDTIEKQVRLGQFQPGERMAARVAVEKAKTGAEVKDSKTPPIVSLLAGGVAGGAEAAATYPFEFAKTRVQLRSESGQPVPRNPFVVVRDVLRNEGATALYKGCSSLIIGSVAKDGVRFLSFDTIKNAFADPETHTLTPTRNLLAGMASGVVASVFAVTPTERIKTALIDDARTAKRFNSTSHAVRVIYQEHGLLGLYRGFAGTTLKQASATAFRMGTYNILKDFEQRKHITQNTAVNFANGAVAGIVTTYATQPFDTIKTRSQSAKGASTMEAVKSVSADYGVRGFWKGTTMRLGRTIFSGGILFTVYERVAAMLNPMFRR